MCVAEGTEWANTATIGIGGRRARSGGENRRDGGRKCSEMDGCCAPDGCCPQVTALQKTCKEREGVEKHRVFI